MVEARIYRLRLGSPWRDLPAYFGPWRSVDTRWRRWNKAGVWTQALTEAGADAEGVLRFVDATHVKVHQAGANPAGGQAGQAMSRTRGGLNTKVTAVVELQGRSVALAGAAGATADVVAGPAIPLPAGHQIVGDKGYDSAAFREEIRQAGSTPCIPPRKNRTKPVRWHRGWYRRRHEVENFFQRIKTFRGVATRYDKLAATFLNAVRLVALLDWIRF